MSDRAPDPLDQLHRTFGARLYGEAQRLVDAGCVSDVRVLQAGRIVTGIALAQPPGTQNQRAGNGSPQGAGTDGAAARSKASRDAAAHRVYIEYPDARADEPRGHETAGRLLAGECNCGERSPCVHVAAVSIAAANELRKVPADSRRAGTGRPPRTAVSAANTGAAGTQQRLYYLIVSRTGPGGVLQLSIWVGQSPAGSERMQPGSACPFEPRRSNGSGGFPRYVDAQDRHILSTLTARHPDGPWELHGQPGADLLLRALATGRMHWQSLDRPALRCGARRPASLTWEILPDGAQQLRCEPAGCAAAILDLEPAIYVDAASNECGPLELPCCFDPLRHDWSRAPIAPEQVAEVNERIERDAGAAFPRLQPMPVHRQALRCLQARLVLSADARAILYFLYDGVAVEAGSLRAGQTTVRGMAGDALHEFDRDRAGEARLQAQLDAALPDLPRDHVAWLAFMMNSVPALREAGWQVVADEQFPYRIVQPGEWYADLETDRRHRWFDLRLGALIEGRRVNLLPALVSYLQAAAGPGGAGTGDASAGDHPAGNPSLDGYSCSDPSCCRIGAHLLVRLDDGRYLPLAIERIRRIADTLVELFDRDSLSDREALALPASQASRLAPLARELGNAALRSDDRSLRALIEELTDVSPIQPLPAPAAFRATLRPYQQEALGWLQFLRRHRLGGILADDMGLGKTVQALAHLLLEKEQGRLRKPSLIVAPVSVIGNWQQEIGRLAPDLNVLVLHGSRRRELFACIDAADIVVTGYPLLLIDGETWLQRELGFVILDEAQMIRNARARVSRAARALRAEHRLCLTGTPMENHLGELWSLFDFAQPGLLGTEKEFQRLYRTPIEKHGDRRRAEALARRIAPFVLRRTKDAVARELPPKTQIVESIVLGERQRDFYDGIRLAMHRRVQEVVAQQGLARSQITVLDALLKLRQACCDPRLLGAGAPAHAPAHTIPSAKLEWLLTVLPELVAEGRRILLFSQFASMLRLIEAAVSKCSIPYLTLTGETRQRAALVERFQAGAVPLFLISLKAGGTGLNLTAADTIIHYDPWWNPAAQAQATDRAHRIGQDKPVFVYKLIAQGTIEERILQLQEEKQALLGRLYAPHSASPSQLSAADLETLFAA